MSSEEAKAVVLAQNYYQIFGLPSSTHFDETLVRKAYRKLALKLHPDKTSDPLAKEAWQRLSVAIQTLVDPAKRAAYNKGVGGKAPAAAPAASAWHPARSANPPSGTMPSGGTGGNSYHPAPAGAAPGGSMPSAAMPGGAAPRHSMPPSGGLAQVQVQLVCPCCRTHMTAFVPVNTTSFPVQYGVQCTACATTFPTYQPMALPSAQRPSGGGCYGQPGPAASAPGFGSARPGGFPYCSPASASAASSAPQPGQPHTHFFGARPAAAAPATAPAAAAAAAAFAAQRTAAEKAAAAARQRQQADKALAAQAREKAAKALQSATVKLAKKREAAREMRQSEWRKQRAMKEEKHQRERRMKQREGCNAEAIDAWHAAWILEMEAAEAQREHDEVAAVAAELDSSEADLQAILAKQQAQAVSPVSRKRGRRTGPPTGQQVGVHYGIGDDGKMGECHHCKDGGELLCCDRCPKVGRRRQRARVLNAPHRPSCSPCQPAGIPGHLCCRTAACARHALQLRCLLAPRSAVALLLPPLCPLSERRLPHHPPPPPPVLPPVLPPVSRPR